MKDEVIPPKRPKPIHAQTVGMDNEDTKLQEPLESESDKKIGNIYNKIVLCRNYIIVLIRFRARTRHITSIVIRKTHIERRLVYSIKYMLHHTIRNKRV